MFAPIDCKYSVYQIWPFFAVQHFYLSLTFYLFHQTNSIPFSNQVAVKRDWLEQFLLITFVLQFFSKLNFLTYFIVKQVILLVYATVNVWIFVNVFVNV